MLSRASPQRFTSLRVAAGWRFSPFARPPSTTGRGGSWMEEELPRTLPRDVPDCHERQAVDFRAPASTTTIARVKTRLLREAEEHEQTARGEPVLVYRAVQIQATRRRKLSNVG
jgi:hypothetical protein